MLVFFFFFNIVIIISFAFSLVVNKSLHVGSSDPLFHSCYDVVRKMFPAQSIFHQPGQMESRKCQIWIIQWLQRNSPAQIGNVLHCLQRGVWPGIIVLQEKGPHLLWSDSHLSLQLSSHSHNLAVRV